MPPAEKVYFDAHSVQVTASRVIVGEKNYVLRNIASVSRNYSPPDRGTPLLAGILFLLIAIGLYYIDSPGIGTLTLAVAIFFIWGAFKVFGIHSVVIHSAGTLPVTLYFRHENADAAELEPIDKIVAAISQALVDLDETVDGQNSTVSTPVTGSVPASNADEILKFKGLLDAGVISQDEFDQKKKELLGL